MKALKYALATLAGLLAVLLAWGFVEPYFLDVREETVEIAGLPPAWEGRRVAQVSDFQVGMWLDNTATVRKAMTRIVDASPALVLITGDFLYHAVGDKESQIAQTMALMQPLIAAGLPTYAVLGNHDYSMAKKTADVVMWEGEMLRDSLEAAGIRVLENEAVALPPPEGETPDTAGTAGGTLYLAGIRPRWPGLSEPEAALRGVPDGAPRLVMMHHPDSYEALPAHAAPLAVAGHTHGGQLRLPFLPDWTWLTFARDDKVHADGWIDDFGAPGNRLYVNRGIGFSNVPIRINCPPELTLFTLRRGEPRGQGDG